MNRPRFSFESTRASFRFIGSKTISSVPTGPLTRTPRIRARSYTNLGIDNFGSRSSHWM